MKSPHFGNFLVSALLLFASLVLTARHLITGCMSLRLGPPVCGDIAMVQPIVFWIATLVMFGISIAKYRKGK